MAKEVNVGKAYFETRAKKDKLKQDFNEINTLASREAKSIQGKLENFRLKFDGAIMKLELGKVQSLAVKLRKELAKKIKLNADIQSIERTRLKLNSVENALRGIGTQATKVKSKTSGMFSGMASKLAGAIGGMYALKKAWDFTIEAKNSARDAEETGSKFNTVFESIEKKANSMADTLARKFGLAGTTARELLGDTGDLLVGFGFSEESALDLSSQVNILAQDLSSFTNFAGGAKGANQALTKAILGETEGVKALGIVLRQNTPEFKAQMKATMESQGVNENQARALVLLAEAYKQSGKAVGDYARTKDSLANVEKRGQEETKKTLEVIGKRLLPLFLTIAKASISFTQSIRELTNALIPAGTNLEAVEKKGRNQALAFETLVVTYERLRGKVNKTTEETEDYKDVVTQLQGLYPDLLGNLDLQSDKLEDVRAGFEGVRKEMEAGLRIEFKQAEAKDVIGEQEAIIKKRIDAQKKGDEILARYNLIKAGKLEDKTIISGGTAQNESDVLESRFKQNLGIIDRYTTQIDEKQKEIGEILGTIELEPDSGKGKGKGEDDDAGTLGLIAEIKKEIKELNKEKLKISEDENSEKNFGIINARIEVLKDKLKKFNEIGLKVEIDADAELDAELDKILKEQDEADKKRAERMAQEGAGLNPNFKDDADEIGNTLVTGAQNFGLALQNALNDGKTIADKNFGEIALGLLGIVASVGSGDFSGAFSGAVSLFAHDGGTFQGGKKIGKYAGGTSQMIPFGNPNDSFPMSLGGAPAFGESGELVTVTPASEVGKTEGLISETNTLIRAMNMNLSSKLGKQNIIVKNNINSDNLVQYSFSPSENKLKAQGVKLDER